MILKAENDFQKKNYLVCFSGETTTQLPLFYGHYTDQPALADTSIHALQSGDVTEETFRRLLKTFLFNYVDN